MSESQGGAGRREVAYRLFASEFDDAELSYSEGEEERAPNYVVTPTGARVNRLFVVGVLTEIETVSEDYLRARVVDPTGPYVVYAGQYQPEALAFLERAEPPLFVAVTGKARTYQPDDADQVYTSIRPENVNEVDARTRDAWVVGTAEQTVERVARAAEAKATGLAGDDLRTALEAHGVDEGLAAGIPRALQYYGTTGDYLAAIRDTALDAARVVAGELDEIEPDRMAPDEGGDDPIPSLAQRAIDTDVVATREASGEEPAEAVSADAASTDAASTEDAPTGAEESREPAGTAAETERQEAAVASVGGGSSEHVDEDATAVEPGDEASTESEPADESSAETEPADEASTGPETVDETTDAGSEASATEIDAEDDGEAAEEGGEDDGIEDFEPEFDLDEEERDEIEAEYGTEFQSGTDVDEPGEADIDTPGGEEPDDTPDDEPDPADADAAGSETAEAETAAEAAEAESADAEAAEAEPANAEAGEAAEDAEAEEVEPEDDADVEPADDAGDAEPVEDVDLADAVVDAMTELDEGDGADREAVLAAVVDRTGADPDAVEEAIQDALMEGRCYEPDEETLKPI